MKNNPGLLQLEKAAHSNKDRSCAPRWPAEGGPATVSEVGAAVSTAHPLQQLPAVQEGTLQNTRQAGPT